MPRIGDCCKYLFRENISNYTMPAFRQRIWVALIATSLGTVVGAFAGYLLVRVITLKQAEARLARCRRAPRATASC